MSAPDHPKRLRAVVLGDTASSNHHGCQLVMTNLLDGLHHAGVEVIARHSGLNWKSNPSLVNALQGADLLVINGEGTIHHDRPLGEQYIAAGEGAASYRVPSFLINCTWQANREELARRAGVFRRIYVRESLSREELAGAGTPSEVVPDLTLATAPPPASPARSGWLITDSAPSSMTARLYRLSRQLPGARFAPVISRDWSRARFGRRVKRRGQWLIGKALGPGGLCPIRYLALAVALRSPPDYLAQLSRAEAILAGRFHAACFALLTQTPLLAVQSNTAKIEALLHDAGLRPERLLAAEELTPDRVTTALREAAFSAAETAACVRYTAQARAAIRGMFAAIVQEVAGR